MRVGVPLRCSCGSQLHLLGWREKSKADGQEAAVLFAGLGGILSHTIELYPLKAVDWCWNLVESCIVRFLREVFVYFAGIGSLTFLRCLRCWH